jgi:hypothetical protein
VGRSCSVCPHPQAEAIDKALVSGVPIRALARQYELSRDALARHKDKHLSAGLVRVAQERQERQAESLLGQIEEVIADVREVVRSAKASGSSGLILQAADRLERLLRLVGQVTGELKPDGPTTTINILQSPEILQVIRAVRTVLSDQPDRLQQFSDLMRLPEHVE